MRFATTERKDIRKQSFIGMGLFGGLLVFVCGGILTWMLSISSVLHATATRDPDTGAVNSMGNGVYVPWGILIMTLGALVAAASVIYGLVHARNPSKESHQFIQNARVIALFAPDKTGVLYTEANQMQFIDGLKYNVRIVSASEGSIEYQCVEEVFWMCGEGLEGDAQIRGRWLGGFKPYQVPHVPVV